MGFHGALCGSVGFCVVSLVCPDLFGLPLRFPRVNPTSSSGRPLSAWMGLAYFVAGLHSRAGAQTDSGSGKGRTAMTSRVSLQTR